MRSLPPRVCLVVSLGLSLVLPAVSQSRSSLEARRKALNDLLAEQWEQRLRASPPYASFVGDKRWNDQPDDFSQAAIDKEQRETQKFLTRFEAIDTTSFPEQE